MPSARPALARRYAEALFDQLASAEERQSALVALTRLGELWAGERDVRRLLTAPSLVLDERVEALAKLLGEQPPGPVLDLVRMVLERRRQGLIPLLPQAFRDTMDGREGVLRGTVTSAAPLSAEQRAGVQALAERLVGGPVRVDEQIDEALIGGLRLRLGDRLADASLRTQLERLVQAVVVAPLPRGPAEEGD